MINFDDLFKYVDNPITRALIAAGGAVAAITATTAFAPVGVVGAAGWTLVYLVFGGTFSIDAARRMWNTYCEMSAEKRQRFDSEMDKLKRMMDEEVITKEQFNKRAEELYRKYSG